MGYPPRDGQSTFQGAQDSTSSVASSGGGGGGSGFNPTYWRDLVPPGNRRPNSELWQEALRRDNAAIAANARRNSATFYPEETTEESALLSDAIMALFERLANNPEEAARIFGTVPEAVLYEPVDLTDSLLRTVAGNQAALPGATALTGGINRALTDQALERINRLFPNYAQTASNVGSAAEALSRGELPFEDVMDIVSNRSSLAASLGTPGGSRPATLRDLGLSRLEAINAGNSLFQQMVKSASEIDPITRHSSPQTFMLDPATRLTADITQAENVQASGQSAANLAAQPDPVSRGLAQLEILGNAYTPNIANYDPFNWMGANQFASNVQGAGVNLPS